MTHSCQSNALNCCTDDIFCALHIVLLAIQTALYIYARVAFTNGISRLCSCLSPTELYRPSGRSLLKALFLICLKGDNFCGVLFCGFCGN